MEDHGIGVAVAVDARHVAADVGALRDHKIARFGKAEGTHQDGAGKEDVFHGSTLLQLFLVGFFRLISAQNASQQACDSRPMVSSAMV
ncbi:hypothetical protein D3C87_2078230 [compost metagenome]